MEKPMKELEAEITQLAANIAASTAAWLHLIAVFDDREGYAAWECRSTAAWLNWHCGMALGAAREKVRVSHALRNLPLIDSAFSAGEISYSKVRALTRFATREAEADLLTLAQHCVASDVERLAGKVRTVTASDAAKAADQRSFATDVMDDGTVVFQIRLCPEDAETVLSALDETSKNVPAGTSIRMRRADALVALARGEGVELGRPELVVHVDAEALGAAKSAARCELDDEKTLAAEVARRIGCDATVITMSHRHRSPLSVGRRHRVITPAQRRALKERDGGCKFPGCTERRFVDGHHIDHWAFGGPTDLPNLMLLCRRHHRALHEGGVKVDVLTPGVFRFMRANGEHITSAQAEVDLSLVALRCENSTITDESIVSRWDGTTLDYGWVVETFLARAS